MEQDHQEGVVVEQVGEGWVEADPEPGQVVIVFALAAAQKFPIKWGLPAITLVAPSAAQGW